MKSKSGQLTWGPIMIAILVIIVVVAVTFIMIKGFSFATSTSNDGVKTYEDGLGECTEGYASCHDILTQQKTDSDKDARGETS